MDDRYAPTEPVPFDRQTPLVPPWHDEIPTRLDRFSRDDCALLIDFYLRRLVALKNRVDPGLAAGLARMRDGEKHRRLGFVRMKDYAGETLDLDWRRARYLLAIHDSFQGLPLLAKAFEDGRLSWTRAREITTVADAETQGRWLEFSCSATVRLLAGAVRRFKADGRLPWGVDENAARIMVDEADEAERGDEAVNGVEIVNCRDFKSDVPASAGGECSSDDSGKSGEERIPFTTSVSGSEKPGGEEALGCGRDQHAGERWPTFSCQVPPALRLRWEAAVEACRRQAGAETPLWECAEYMAAEILDTVSGLEGVEEPGGNGPSGERGMVPGIGGGNPLTGGGRAEPGGGHLPDDNSTGTDREARWNSGNHPAAAGEAAGRDNQTGLLSEEDRDLIKAGIEKEYGNWSFLSWAPVMVRLVGQLEADLRLVKSAAAGAAGRDGAHRLNEALLRLMGYHEQIERYLGRLLRFFGDHRLHERCRFLSLRHYARERLGVSARQVGYLTSRERVFIHHPELEEAFLDGRIGSAKVRLLEPFARRLWPCHWKAWVERAERVTVRRLADEANWAVDFCQRDPAGWLERKGSPPAPGEGPYAGVDGQWHTCSGGGSDKFAGEARGAGMAGASPVPGMNPEGTTDGGWHICSGHVESAEEQTVENSDADCPAPGVSGHLGQPGSFDAAAGDLAAEGISAGCPAPGVLPGERGFGAGRDGPPLSSLVRFSAPPESAAVWRRAMDACRRLIGDDAPAWRCLEMIVDHFLLVWAPENDPDHRTTGYPHAVFQRDGWRCTVPGCRAGSNLTPHHIVRRSRGGGDEMANLTTVCWKHHLEGIHRGLVRVDGRAPDQLVWELGRMAGQAPVLAASGDWVLGASRHHCPALS